MTFGTHLTSQDDPLKRVSVEQVLYKIKNPSIAFESQISRLRVIKSLDSDSYKKQKVLLPYFVCSLFHPLFRKKENFAAAYHMVIDIDHCLSQGFSLNNIKIKLSEDPEIRAVFISPSGDGLKVILDFDQPITDPALYSLFYKKYLFEFAKKYALENVVDFVTHDISRACFFSADRNAYINENCKPLEVGTLIDESNQSVFFEVEKAFRAEAAKHDNKGLDNNAFDKVLDDDTLNKIKSKLFPKRIVKEKPSVYVPAEIDSIRQDLANHLKQFGMELKGEDPIQYGRKLRIEGGKYFAELNIFYGKKGFSVVKTPKTGSNRELAELAYEAIMLFFN